MVETGQGYVYTSQEVGVDVGLGYDMDMCIPYRELEWMWGWDMTWICVNLTGNGSGSGLGLDMDICTPDLSAKQVSPQHYLPLTAYSILLHFVSYFSIHQLHIQGHSMLPGLNFCHSLLTVQNTERFIEAVFHRLE